MSAFLENIVANMFFLGTASPEILIGETTEMIFLLVFSKFSKNISWYILSRRETPYVILLIYDILVDDVSIDPSAKPSQNYPN